MKAKILCGVLIVAFLLTGFSAWGQTADDIRSIPPARTAAWTGKNSITAER